jgi:steroid 5-alpha reductase family enzyme
MPIFLQILIALGALAALFHIAFHVCRRLDNYGFVDVVWSYALGLIAAFYALVGQGWSMRRGLLALLVGVWSLRLGTHLWVRLARHHPTEDPRYGAMRERWSGQVERRMAVFFQQQDVSVVVLGLPFLLIAANRNPGFSALEWAALGLLSLAVLGEGLADAQLAAFKREPGSRGRVCQRGLWYYSRHPNYFFEWLIWVGYGVFALAAPWGWLGLIAPAAILHLLLNVTGIPLAERQSVRTKGDAYIRYQQSTSAFVPWPPRRLPEQRIPSAPSPIPPLP